MTSSNLLGYLGESNSSTASKKPAQHIKQWQLQSRILTLQRVDTGEMYLVFGDADYFLQHHRAPGMEALDKTKLQSLLNGNYKSHGAKTDVYTPDRRSGIGWRCLRLPPPELVEKLPWDERRRPVRFKPASRQSIPPAVLTAAVCRVCRCWSHPPVPLQGHRLPAARLPRRWHAQMLGAPTSFVIAPLLALRPPLLSLPRAQR